jgi:uncharacterized membrane protein
MKSFRSFEIPKESLTLTMIIGILILDLVILLNIPVLRQVFGFFFLTLFPGILILKILKLNDLSVIEKFLFSVGLSISFLMLVGLFINYSFSSLGYKSPLSTIPILFSFSLIFIIMILGSKWDTSIKIYFPIHFFTAKEKLFLILPFIFPTLSIVGVFFINKTGNNFVIMLLLMLIVMYVIIICFFDKEIPERLYPLFIFSISISLLLLLSLRSNHIIGIDAHKEYLFFRTTLNGFKWDVFNNSRMNACLSVSLLPTIYYSILNVNPESLFKILYPLIYSSSPLAIYILSRKYISETFSFLASCFFMFQFNFIWTSANARTNLAIFFYILSMVALFSDKISLFNKRVLLILFMFSVSLSHYSTTYIYFFEAILYFICIEIISKKYPMERKISYMFPLLFFAFVFFWYSEITTSSFEGGLLFIKSSLVSLNDFFVQESRGDETQALFGAGLMEKSLPYSIEFFFRWFTFLFIGIGIITMILKYKETSFPKLNVKNVNFMKQKFEVEYFVMSLIAAGLLIITVALPYVSEGYGIDRIYGLAITFLSIFFVIGGISISKVLNNNKSQLQTYAILLFVLIPYFFCISGVTYNLFGESRSIILNSEGSQCDSMYVFDQEVTCSKWIEIHNAQNLSINSDRGGLRQLLAYSKMTDKSPHLNINFFEFNETDNDSYLFLRRLNVIEKKVIPNKNVLDIDLYTHLFIDKKVIYNNGDAKVLY